MTTFKNITLFATITIVSIGCLACRKQRGVPETPSSREPTQQSDSSSPAPQSPAPVPMSQANQAVIQKKFMSSETPWLSKTATQKRDAYYGWCQQYMFGDAAAKARVAGDIKGKSLPLEDLKALKEFNQKLGFPPMTL